MLTLSARCVGNVAQPPPQAAPLEIVEAEVPIERGSSVVDGVHHDSSRTEFCATSDTPAQSVDQQVATQFLALLGADEGQPDEHDDRDGVWYATPPARRCGGVRYRPHGEGVVPDNIAPAEKDVRGRRPRPRRHSRCVHEPTVQFLRAGVEALDIVPFAEQFDGTKGRVAHLEGMGPREDA